jgi:hypothetical protein
MKSLTARAIVAGIAIATAGALGCSSHGGPTPAASDDQGTGTIGMQLGVAPGVTINTVQWTIHNPALLAADLTGSVDVSQSQEIKFIVGGLPAGDGYTITLTATAQGPTSLMCAGSAAFSIIAHATSAVSVNLVCTGPAVDAGSNGSVNITVIPSIPPFCAIVNSRSAMPASVDVGAKLLLTATGVDSNGSSAVGFLWAVTGGTGSGTFSSSTSASPTFTCTGAGPVTVTVTATTSGGAACTNNTASIDLTCTAPTGTPDASAVEAGPPEAGPPEAGPPEAGPPEAGPPEAGPPEAGPPEAGPPEAGPPEAGPPEAGHDAALEAEAGPPPPDLCNPATPGAGTAACIGQQDKTTTATPETVCSTCMAKNCFDVVNAGGPGICETVTGTAALFSGTLPDGKTCAATFPGFTPPIGEKTICLATLDGIFKSHCASSLNVTPCLCGLTDVNTCLAGTATPTGPVYDVYACDFTTTNGATINDIHNNFQVPTFGSGQANAIAACGTSFGCDCY